MSQPTVCAVMLTRERPEMMARAVRCFRAQTYPNKRLLIAYCQMADLPSGWSEGISAQCVQYLNRELTIGKIRNMAVSESVKSGSSDIICHWDDDDHSHPRRIEEQVALLQSSGADCVGYNEMLFWREPAGEAWLYSNADSRYCIGTSLCYWRAAWERRPFADLPKQRGGTGEDWEFQRELKRVAISALHERSTTEGCITIGEYEPRMVATIHAGNTADYSPEHLRKSASNWTRVPGWDVTLKKIMEAA